MKKKNVFLLTFLLVGFFLTYTMDNRVLAYQSIGGVLNGETTVSAPPAPVEAVATIVTGGCNYTEKCCKCYNAERVEILSKIQESKILCADACRPLPGAKNYSYGENLMETLIEVAPVQAQATVQAVVPSSNTLVPGQKGPVSQIIKCGRAGENMCTLCDLIAGLNYIIKYLMRIAVGVALLAITIGGVMYVISASDSGLVDTAKSTIKNAAVGFLIIFAGYLIINTTISYIGSRTTTDASGVPRLTFGMNIKSWGEFDCNAADRGGN